MNRYFLYILASLALLTACDQTEDVSNDQRSSSTAIDLSAMLDIGQLNADAWNEYWKSSALECLTRLELTAREMEAQVEILLAEPSQLSLAHAQQAWESNHQQYLKCSIYSQPIPLSFEPSLIERLNLIDTWPVQGGYIDSIPGYPSTGIVNDLSVRISKQVLIEQNQLTDFADVSVGLHALEFLLWGEGNSRSAVDFQPANPESDELGIELNPNNRRRHYIELLTALIKENQAALTLRWENIEGSLANAMSKMTDSQKLAFMLSSLTSYLDNLQRYYPQIPDTFLADESTFSETTRESLVSGYTEFAQALRIWLRLNQATLSVESSGHQEMEKIAQTLQGLTESIDQLPELTQSTITDWQNQALSMTVQTDLLSAQLIELSQHMQLRLSYEQR